jgi:hypothetical protein
MVAPRIGNWLSNPVSCPPSIGATTVIVVVTEPAITIRAGTSHLGGADGRDAGPRPRGQYRTIAPIPPNATSAPITGASTTTRNTTPSTT